MQVSRVCVFGTHMFPLRLQVLWVPHQLPIHFVPHLLGNDLSLTCVVIQLVQYGVEWQTGCEPAGGKYTMKKILQHIILFVYFYFHISINDYFHSKNQNMIDFYFNLERHDSYSAAIKTILIFAKNIQIHQTNQILQAYFDSLKWLNKYKHWKSTDIFVVGGCFFQSSVANIMLI